MKNKQTAVEWLVQEINKINVSTEARIFINKLEKQAKAMEKEQIIDAYDIGFADALDDARYDDEPKYATAEQYYNETYKSNT